MSTPPRRMHGTLHGRAGGALQCIKHRGAIGGGGYVRGNSRSYQIGVGGSKQVGAGRRDVWSPACGNSEVLPATEIRIMLTFITVITVHFNLKRT